MEKKSYIDEDEEDMKSWDVKVIKDSVLQKITKGKNNMVTVLSIWRRS